MDTRPPLIVVGAGLAGWTAVREFRKHDRSTPVIVVTADDGDFCAKPSLSNAFAQGKAPAQLISTPAARMVESLQVTLLQRTRVQRIDAAAQSVATSQGRFSYGQLVLATGAQPIRVPLAGDAANEVLSVNHLDDFAQLHARLQRPSRVLVMGAGLIGCEFANDLAIAGHEVTVVDPAPRAIAALLPAEASHALHDALRPLGVRFVFGRSVQSLERHGSGLRARLSAAPANAHHGEGFDAADALVTADLVLSAVGLRADTTLAQTAGIVCDRGILVDAHLRTSHPAIFALGDNAQYGSVGASAGGRTLPYVMPIMNAARVLGPVLAGVASPPLRFPLMPVAIKTPALPLVVAPAAPGTQGEWSQPEPGLWRFTDGAGAVRGFALAGAQTARRMEQAQLISE
jgi:rubredoxin-NAD+ reductase